MAWNALACRLNSAVYLQPFPRRRRAFLPAPTARRQPLQPEYPIQMMQSAGSIQMIHRSMEKRDLLLNGSGDIFLILVFPHQTAEVGGYHVPIRLRMPDIHPVGGPFLTSRYQGSQPAVYGFVYFKNLPAPGQNMLRTIKRSRQSSCGPRSETKPSVPGCRSVIPTR